MADGMTTFERVEKKYLLTRAQTLALRTRLAGRMRMDAYGRSLIENIYYDTADYALIRASLEKPAYKEKVRLRSYGVPKADDPVFLELKKKYDGVVYKRRVKRPLEEAARFMSGRGAAGADQIERELAYARDLYGLAPRMFLSYERVALYGLEDPAFRVTFDCSILYRTEALDLTAGAWGEPLLAPDQCLMEVKTCRALPLWFSRTLSELGIYPTTFSKYGRAYRLMLSETKGGRNCA